MEKYVVSARKYRPTKFQDVVGQDHVTTTLQNAVKNNKVAQSLLFCGPRGVGKTTCARILANEINNFDFTNPLESSNNFNIYDLNKYSGEYRLLKDGADDQPDLKYEYPNDEIKDLFKRSFKSFLSANSTSSSEKSSSNSINDLKSINFSLNSSISWE